VNARELHRRLKVGRFFANWIKDRIKKYDFVENIDYFKVIPYKDLKQSKKFDCQNWQIKNLNEVEMQEA